MRPVVQPGANITVRGIVMDALNPPNGFSNGNVNVTAAIQEAGVSRSQVTTASGFTFNLTAPTTLSSARSYAPYAVYVTDNTTHLHNKTFFVYVSNATNITFTFVDSFPPFGAGLNATINVSYFNGSSPIVGGKPLVEVIRLNGVRQTWVVTNLSATTNAQGILQYNVTIPSDAAGQFALAVDRGFGFMVFGIRSAYVPSFKTETVDGQRRSEFATNAVVSLVGIVRTSGNIPYNLAGSDSATAFVTLPNGTIVSTALTVRDAADSPGIISSNFAQTNLGGRYNVRLVVTIAGSAYETFGYLDVGSMTATLETGRNFFEKWGDKRIILPNSTIEFSVLALNASSGNLLSGKVAATANDIFCNQGNVTFIGYTNLLTGQNVTEYNQFEPGMPAIRESPFTSSINVCVIRLKAPRTTGVYRIDVNVTGPAALNRPVVSASAIISVETIVLRARPIQAAGGFDSGEFSFNLPPGENATFQLVAYNFSSGQPITASAIQNVTVQSLAPMSFFGGGLNAFTNFSVSGTGACSPCGNRPNPGIPYYVSYPGGTEARVVITLPDSSGFFEGAIRANVSGQFVTGRTNFMMKRLEGGAMPLSGTTVPGQQGGQQGQGPDFNFGQTSCKIGNVTMFAMVQDVKTAQAAQGVQINPNIIGAFDESSGRNIASQLRIDMINSTDSRGQMIFNLTLVQDLSNGFYPIEFNVTYRGRDETIFGMLNCQGRGAGGAPGSGGSSDSKSLTIGRPAGARIRPNFLVPLTWDQFFIVGSTGMGGSGSLQIVNGTLEITGAFMYNEQDRSSRFFAPNASQPPLRVNITNNMSNVLLEPANFSLTEWPVGNFRLQLNVSNGSIPGFREGPSFVVGNDQYSYAGGFEVKSFEVFIHNNTPLMSGLAAGDLLSLMVNVSSNVSIAGNNFTAIFERYGFGNVIEAQPNSARLVIDAWNGTMDPGFEQWEVNVTIPVGLEPGFIGVRFSVNNSQGLEESSGSIGTKISRFLVLPLLQHNLELEGLSCAAYDEGYDNGTFGNCFGRMGPLFNYGNATHMNLSRLNTTYGVASKSGRVCLHREFNYSRFQSAYSWMGVPTSVDRGSHLVVVDNTTPKVYDTLVINTTNGTQQIISLVNFTSAHRQIRGNTTAPYSSFYVANIFECGLVTLVDGTQTPTQGDVSEGYLGEFFTNDVWYAPVRILRGSAAVQGNITFAGYALKSNDGNTEGALADSGHVTTASQTNAFGVGFVRSNVTRLGRFSAVWDVNATINGQVVTDRAKTRSDSQSHGGGQGPRVEVIKFRIDRQSTYSSGTTNNFNVTVMVDARDRNFAQLMSGSFRINLISWNRMGSTSTPARLFNSSNGAVVTSIPAVAGMGGTQLIVTHPTGWPCNQDIQLEGNLTSGADSQLFFLGSTRRNC